MKTIKINEIMDFMSKEENLWFIGQRKWTNKLAMDILQREKEIRENKRNRKDDTDKLGLVFLTDQKNITEEVLNSCDKMEIFNSNVHFRIISLGNNQYLFGKNEKCCSEEIINPTMITSSEPDSISHSYRFANFIGSISDSNIQKIGIKYCSQCLKWRFYHE